MGNWRLVRWQEPKALTTEVLRELRTGQPAGLSRRQVIRRSLGAIVALWTLEITGGTIAFLWPNLSSGFGATLTLGDFDTVKANPAVQGADITTGAPSYFQDAKTYVTLLDPTLGFQTGNSPAGRRRRDQRAHALPALHASRLQAQLLHQELLVRVSLPRVAL